MNNLQRNKRIKETLPLNIDFSPSKSLFALPVVRWSAGLFAALATFSFAIIAFKLRHYPFDFSGQGFNRFAIYYKVPTGFLAIGFTLVGLCAANHRSEQSKAQMALTANQNIFANHFKHLEEFEKYCKARHEHNEAAFRKTQEFYSKHKSPIAEFVRRDTHITPTHYRAVYRQIFPDSKSGDFAISNEYLGEIGVFIEQISDLLTRFSAPDATQWPKAVIQLYDTVNKYAKENSIVLEESSTTVFEYDGQIRKIFLGDASALFVQAQDVIHVQAHSLSFDTTYVPNSKVINFLAIDFEKIGSIDVSDFSSLPIKTEYTKLC